MLYQLVSYSYSTVVYYGHGSLPMDRDPKLDHLKILLSCLFFFCKHLQRVKLVESNNKINATPLHSSQLLLHVCKRKTPAVKFLASGDCKVIKRFEVVNDLV